MNYGTYSFVALRTCSLESFTEYINQETNIGRLSLIGGNIIHEIDPRRIQETDYYSKYLLIDKSLAINDGTVRLEIIKNRRNYLHYLHEKYPIIELEIKRGTSESVNQLIRKIELYDKKETNNELEGITPIKSKIEKGESSNSNNI